ncbi:MAG: GTPase ObgE [Candidatus Saccharimonadales bacterium]
MFVDTVSVRLVAGDGGDGAVSFRHEKFVDKGGPDGGDGGDGGDIVVKASRNQNTLAALRYKKLLSAEHGGPGTKRRRHGKNGQDLEVKVPVGTVITRQDGAVVADLTEDGQEEVIASGGKGGFGNAHFVSSRRQAPRVAEKGEKGQEIEATLELKMIADAGIVGLPNAGKSTFLSVVSNAKPAIANYPFTTLVPNLGVVDIDSQSGLLLADIPGLIEGAHAGKGLGDEFLRHVERTSVLVHLVDAYNEDLPRAYKTIISELAAYKVDLSRRPQIVALTKTEGLDKQIKAELIADLKKLVPRGTVVRAISSVSGEGVQELLHDLLKTVDKTRKATAKKKTKQKLPVIGLKQQDRALAIEEQGDNFLVTGSKIESFARRTKFGDEFGEQRLRDIMAKMGITRELHKKGIKVGQKIVIGQPPVGELDY